jgi:hypothetical protein
MSKRTLFVWVAAGVLVWGCCGLEARAAQVILPAQLNAFLPTDPNTFALVPILSLPGNNLRFDTFEYTTSPVNSPPAAADVTVSEFHAGVEDGIKFTGAFQAAAPSGMVDYTIAYVVHGPAGLPIIDASLSAVMGIFGGTGTVDIAETLINKDTGAVVGHLEVFLTPTTSKFSDTMKFTAGVTNLLVEKDVILNGGSAGATVSVINQGYSVPEPASIALLGIGISGLFALRRFFKRPPAA